MGRDRTMPLGPIDRHFRFEMPTARRERRKSASEWSLFSSFRQFSKRYAPPRQLLTDALPYKRRVYCVHRTWRLAIPIRLTRSAAKNAPTNVGWLFTANSTDAKHRRGESMAVQQPLWKDVAQLAGHPQICNLPGRTQHNLNAPYGIATAQTRSMPAGADK
jgi:hypothetical protein